MNLVASSQCRVTIGITTTNQIITRTTQNIIGIDSEVKILTDRIRLNRINNQINSFLTSIHRNLSAINISNNINNSISIIRYSTSNAEISIVLSNLSFIIKDSLIRCACAINKTTNDIARIFRSNHTYPVCSTSCIRQTTENIQIKRIDKITLIRNVRKLKI